MTATAKTRYLISRAAVNLIHAKRFSPKHKRAVFNLLKLLENN